MSGASSADLQEFETLRQEINNRTTISYTLIALDLAALGTGLSLAGKSKAVLAALAISSLLWLYWIDHSGQVQRIGAYIRIKLAPKISADEGQPVLQWELFLRKVNAGGESALEALFGSNAGNDPGLPPVLSSDWYATLLFGGTSPLLLILYGAASVRAGSAAITEAVLAIVSVLALWIYALISYLRLRRSKSITATAIFASNTRISVGLVQPPTGESPPNTSG